MKIISFSLWGNGPKYNIGAIKNAQIARDLYPDWMCRFYFPYPGQDPPALKDLMLMDNVEVRPVRQPGDWRGMFWRFQAASDPECEAMISSDCDSRLSLREKEAVEEWLASERSWHIMRDHPWHGALMLGGMWGVKGCPAMTDWISAWNAEDRYQTDQDFLRSMVYPIASKDAMIHAQFCGIESDATPFPSHRRGLEFVGEVYDENDKTVPEHTNMLFKALKGRGEIIRTPKELQ